MQETINYLHKIGRLQELEKLGAPKVEEVEQSKYYVYEI